MLNKIRERISVFTVKNPTLAILIAIFCLNLVLFAGAAATGGQLSITKAYTKAPAKEISVFDYSQVIFAALLGFVFLQQIPDYLSVIGYVIIIGSAIFKWNYNLRYEEKV